MNSKDRYEYEQYMNMANMQNDYLRQNMLAGLQNATYTKSNPFEGYDITKMVMPELEKTIQVLVQEYERRTLHTPLESPTRAMCKENEALKNAYDEMMVIWKLAGKK